MKLKRVLVNQDLGLVYGEIDNDDENEEHQAEEDSEFIPTTENANQVTSDLFPSGPPISKQIPDYDSDGGEFSTFEIFEDSNSAEYELFNTLMDVRANVKQERKTEETIQVKNGNQSKENGSTNVPEIQQEKRDENEKNSNQESLKISQKEPSEKESLESSIKEQEQSPVKEPVKIPVKEIVKSPLNPMKEPTQSLLKKIVKSPVKEIVQDPSKEAKELQTDQKADENSKDKLSDDDDMDDDEDDGGAGYEIMDYSSDSDENGYSDVSDIEEGRESGSNSEESNHNMEEATEKLPENGVDEVPLASNGKELFSKVYNL